MWAIWLGSDLGYKPWINLLEKVKESQPEVLLLIGPFVNVANTRIKDGDTDETPKELFDRRFAEKIEAFLPQSLWSTVVLAPSVNDAISHHVVFRVFLHPNPMHFFVNGVLFAVTSVDTLFHLRKVEPLIPMSEPAMDGMSNLVRNIFQQRSFYPILHAPFDIAHDVNLDMTYLEGTKFVSDGDTCVPDMLVLLSCLKQFSKVVGNTMVMDPSCLSRGRSAVLTHTGQGTV